MSIFTPSPSPEQRATTREVVPGEVGVLAHLTEAAINVAASSDHVAAGHYEHGPESPLYLSGFMKTLERAGQTAQFQTPGQEAAAPVAEVEPQVTPEQLQGIIVFTSRAGAQLVDARDRYTLAA